MSWIGIAVVVVAALLVVVALLPMVVLLDLAGGGTGLGLCPDGLASCQTSYFDGPELAGMLVIVLLLLALVLRTLMRLRAAVEHTDRDDTATRPRERR